MVKYVMSVVLTTSLIIGVGFVCSGCQKQDSTADDVHQVAAQLTAISSQASVIAQQLDHMNSNLEKIANRKLLPIRKGDAEPELSTAMWQCPSCHQTCAEWQAHTLPNVWTCPSCGKQVMDFSSNQQSSTPKEKSLLVPSQQPDFKLAFARGLQGIAALTGKQKLIEWFQSLAVDIRKVIAPVDIGGVLDTKVKALSADRVNELLNQN